MHDDTQTATGNIARQPLTTTKRTNHQMVTREQRSYSTKSQTILIAVVIPETLKKQALEQLHFNHTGIEKKQNSLHVYQYTG